MDQFLQVWFRYYTSDSCYVFQRVINSWCYGFDVAFKFQRWVNNYSQVIKSQNTNKSLSIVSTNIPLFDKRTAANNCNWACIPPQQSKSLKEINSDTKTLASLFWSWDSCLRVCLFHFCIVHFVRWTQTKKLSSQLSNLHKGIGFSCSQTA